MHWYDRAFNYFVVSTAVCIACAGGWADAGQFFPPVAVGQVPIDEASGLAASVNNPGVLWTHNDSGDGPNFYAMAQDGTPLGTYRLGGTSAFDWEDMTVGPGPAAGQSYLYLGDIGDNNAIRSTIRVHRVLEPTVSTSQPHVDQVVTTFDTFTLAYPDLAIRTERDAEALMVDPATNDLYLVSKRDATPRIYRAPSPLSTTATNLLEFIGELNWPLGNANRISAGDISPNGNQVLLRSRNGAQLWDWPAGQSMAEVLATSGTVVPLANEVQGEAIAFDAQGSGYYSTSEEIGQPIYYYARVPEPSTAVLLVATLAIGLTSSRARLAAQG